MRVVTLLEKYTDGKVPSRGKDAPGDGEFIASLSVYETLSAKMDRLDFDKALDIVIGLARSNNKYIQDNKPWELAKTDLPRLHAVLYNSTEAVRILSIYLDAFLPNASAGIRLQLNTPQQKLADAKFGYLQEGHAVGKAFPLFKKLEPPKRNAFESVDLRAARVIAVEDHPAAEKLYVLRIDLGTEQRTLVAGVKPWYKPEELGGKMVVVVANLEPAKLRGVESQGMLLAAEKDGVVGMLTVDAEPGAQVAAEGVKPKPAASLAFKEFGKLRLDVRGGRAFAEGLALAAGAAPVVCERVSDGPVK
jgi:methionyl-tRNA synthetase